MVPSRGSLLDFDQDPFRRQNTWVRNNHGMMFLKHCATCKIVRPPRSVHCQKCNACVLMLDHHCPWLGTCIGMRNYLSFKIFLNFLLFSLLWSLGLHIYQLIYQCLKHSEVRIGHRAWAQILLVTLYFCGAVFPLILNGYHTYLVLFRKGSTTNESCKGELHIKY